MSSLSYPKIAQFALTIIARASIPATDEFLLYTQATRTILRGIANGTLAVIVVDKSVADIQKGDSTL